jgi:transposase
MDLNNMSKEELMELVLKLQKDNKKKDDKIEKLEAEKRSLNIKLDELIAKYEQKVEVNNKIIADRFLPKCEKFTQFEESINEVELIKETSPRKSPSKRFIEELKSLKSKELIYDFDFDGYNIDIDSVKPFGEDVSYKIEINPLSFDVVEVKRPKYKDKDHIYQSTSKDPFPNSPLTSTLAANIIVMKYSLAVPLHRYAKYMNSFNIMVSPQDLSNYVERTAQLLEPLYNELENSLANTKFSVIHGDETPLQIIDSNKSKCYMFVYATSFWDNPIYIYKFSEKRDISNTIDLLNNFNGYFICDGYTGYDSLPNKVKGNIKIQRCWVHMRRYFFDCLKGLDEELWPNNPAYRVIKKIDQMFKLEENMKNLNYTRNQIKEKRNSSEYQTLIKDLDELILSIDYGNSTYLRKACEHYKNDKNELYTFLEDGYIDIHNNLAERTVRPFTIARKNFLFCKTCDGASITAKLFSIVQTARANGLKVEQYLKYVIDNIKVKNIADLLPWSINLPKELKINE